MPPCTPSLHRFGLDHQPQVRVAMKRLMSEGLPVDACDAVHDDGCRRRGSPPPWCVRGAVERRGSPVRLTTRHGFFRPS